jgi:lysyl oxidase-like protein 2/3/4
MRHYFFLDPHTHRKVSEGHKASYCLADTKCDEGVDQFYSCLGGGNQGISINCHDNYDHTLDCQWVDITDLTVVGRSYKLRLVANPALKGGESDYSNNVVLCDVIDRRNHIQVGACIQGKNECLGG